MYQIHNFKNNLNDEEMISQLVCVKYSINIFFMITITKLFNINLDRSCSTKKPFCDNKI